LSISLDSSYDKVVIEESMQGERLKPLGMLCIPLETYDEMLEKTWKFIVDYSVQKIYIDGANPSFIKPLKCSGEKDLTMRTYQKNKNSL
jgi:hypothetical protein